MFLGLDIGTSSVKAVVINEKGILVGTSEAAVDISRPKPLWSEQDPADWWKATDQAVKALDAALRKSVQAIGLSGQMHGATLLDKGHNVLRPAILWNDGRSAAECDQLQSNESDFLEKGGNLVMPGFTAPKLLWVQKYEPKIFDKVAAVLLPKDYVRLLMSGECASDMSDSAGTLWMDVEKRTWHKPLLDACGLDISQMPKLYEGHQVTGKLRASIANDWGMDQADIVAGGGDNAAGAIGAGVLNDNDALMSLGTSGVIFVAGETYRSNPASAVHAFCHALPDRWHLMSVMLSAASCLDWACKLLGLANVKTMIDLAQNQSNPYSQTIFLPYLSGERTPHNDPHARAGFHNMDHDTSPADMAQAVLEGVAFGMADGFNALIAAGAKIESLSVIGGGSRSQYWGQILASAIGKPLVYREDSATGAAFGAARLAHYSQGNIPAEDAFAPPTIETVVEPDTGLTERLSNNHQNFSNIYTSLSANSGA